LKRLPTYISLFIIIPLGFFGKFYSGPLEIWVNNSLGGVFYDIFWCLLFYLIFPKSNLMRIAVFILIATCLLEILQLWHPMFLEVLRSSFIGRTILGTSFTLNDFPYYFIGSFIGWLWITRLFFFEFKIKG